MPDVQQTHQSPRSSARRERLCHTRALRSMGAAIVAMLFTSSLLAACGSSSSTASSAEVRRACREVGAVLSDGPEPAADPVGYAQAQVLPLRLIHTSDERLHEAISRLAGAYQAFAGEDRLERAANSAVAAAVEKVNAICPGAAS